MKKLNVKSEHKKITHDEITTILQIFTTFLHIRLLGMNVSDVFIV